MTLPKRIFRRRTRDTRLRCPQHRAWIRTFGCCVPGCNSKSPIDCAHVSGGEPATMGRKVGDQWTVALCREHHRESHNIGEPEFERRYGLNLVALAKEFASASPALRHALTQQRRRIGE